MKTDLFQSCGHSWVFQICWHVEWSTLVVLSFRILNSSLSLALFLVMLPKVHLNSHSRMFSSISLHWLLRKIFLSLLAVLWISTFRWIYFFLSPLPFAFLCFSAICKSSSPNHFAFLHFFPLGMVLITAFCTMLWTSVHSSSGTLSDLIPWIYLSLPLYNYKEFDLGHTWMVQWFSLLSSI